MTIKFSIFPDEELMVAKFSGHISDGELVEQYRKYYESNKGITSFNQLILFDEATELYLEMESFIEVSKMAGEYLKNSERSIKTAFVTERLCIKYYQIPINPFLTQKYRLHPEKDLVI
ncbi:MAG: hypothetical protein P8M72_04495 [Gammaproteobacteria bacterium]|nr:hypothetical protein [Gammaproteobacteria bacterium]